MVFITAYLFKFDQKLLASRTQAGPTSETQKVITSGPYRLVRHPMYAGAILLLLFAPLALGSWVALPFPLPLIVVVAVRAIEEEKFLRANLAGYADYCQKVRYRLVPYIW